MALLVDIFWDLVLFTPLIDLLVLAIPVIAAGLLITHLFQTYPTKHVLAAGTAFVIGLLIIGAFVAYTAPILAASVIFINIIFYIAVAYCVIRILDYLIDKYRL